jgi:DNA phosphorothioation-associated putative methyltransferase
MIGATSRHRTAMSRNALSRPVSLALQDGVLHLSDSFFDYGCGRGGDVRHLSALGFRAGGWDPAYSPDAERFAADVVNFGYVANVIEDPSERAEALLAAWALTQRVLVVAARVDWEARGVAGKPFADGILTGNGTFQKFYSQEELRTWINTTLGISAVAAAPGVFYAFRDQAQSQSFLAARVRHRTTIVPRGPTSEALYEANREILGPLEAFISSRGRPPEAFELTGASEVAARFGSIRKATDLIRRVTDEGSWQAAEQAARADVLVYLALAAFGGRPKFAALPLELQCDIRAFFGSYKDACAEADRLLYGAGNQAALEQSCRSARVGKLTPEALYVHTSALGNLPPLLRVYEGCGKALTGRVEGANIVKLNRSEPKVAYLAYPDFDRDPHPALATSVRADLRRLDVKFSDFRTSLNPPILHRKETFVGEDYPRRDTFARLTAQEDRAGLFAEPTTIGTREQWRRTLATHRVQTRGHRLVRAKTEEEAGCTEGQESPKG